MGPVATFSSACLALVLLMSNAPMAAGATARVSDPQGDAPPAYDVRAVRYAHSDARVLAVARVPALGNRGKAQLSVTNFTVFEAGYVGQITRRPGQAPRIKLYYFDHFDLQPRVCAGIDGSWGDTRIRISIPKNCMEGDVADAHRLFVQFAAGRGGDFDLAPAVRRLRQD